MIELHLTYNKNGNRYTNIEYYETVKEARQELKKISGAIKSSDMTNRYYLNYCRVYKIEIYDNNKKVAVWEKE